jgi:hypothetical protein
MHMYEKIIKKPFFEKLQARFKMEGLTEEGKRKNTRGGECDLSILFACMEILQ